MQSIQELGIATRPVDKENSSTPMATSMRAVGPITICVATEFTDIRTERYIVASGFKDKCMVKVKKLGLRGHSITATTKRERNRVRVPIYGSTVRDTMDSGVTMKSMEMVRSLGRMAEATQVSG